MAGADRMAHRIGRVIGVLRTFTDSPPQIALVRAGGIPEIARQTENDCTILYAIAQQPEGKEQPTSQETNGMLSLIERDPNLSAIHGNRQNPSEVSPHCRSH